MRRSSLQKQMSPSRALRRAVRSRPEPTGTWKWIASPQGSATPKQRQGLPDAVCGRGCGKLCFKLCPAGAQDQDTGLTCCCIVLAPGCAMGVLRRRRRPSEDVGRHVRQLSGPVDTCRAGPPPPRNAFTFHRTAHALHFDLRFRSLFFKVNRTLQLSMLRQSIAKPHTKRRAPLRRPLVAAICALRSSDSQHRLLSRRRRTEHQHGVKAAERERVRHGVADLHGPAFVGHIIEVALGIGARCSRWSAGPSHPGSP